MYKKEYVTRRYSEAFKLKILSELSTGKYSKRELGRIYGIDPSTMNEWIKKYDRKDLMNTRIMVENLDEISRIKALQKEIEQLKKLLLKKDIDHLVLESYLKVAAENLGYKSVEELKKKLRHRALMKAVSSAKQAGLAGIGTICNCFGQQRDAFYKFKKRYTTRKAKEEQVVKLVEKERKEQPRVGTRKLKELLSPALEQAEIKVGRDGLFRILREHRMLVGRKKTTCKTTHSYHRFHKYTNLIKDME